jgi:hypothetical protein
MRYMMLIYSKEQPGGPGRDIAERDYSAHMALMEEAARKGLFVAAEPLAPTSSATTVRVESGKGMITDGPFAETKEQLAGYYILDCRNLDEAIEWAARIPTACKGGEGCVEIRPMPGIPARPQTESVIDHAGARNG